jgi:hypothetical protein
VGCGEGGEPGVAPDAAAGEVERTAEGPDDAAVEVLAEPAGVTGEQRWLARVMFAEALSEPAEARKAVGAVILNRVEHDAYPADVYSVVHQRGGFTSVTQASPLWKKSDDWAAMSQVEKREWVACLEQAGEVLGGDRRPDLIAFKNVGLEPDAYFRQLDPAVTLGKLRFYTK